MLLTQSLPESTDDFVTDATHAVLMEPNDELPPAQVLSCGADRDFATHPAMMNLRWASAWPGPTRRIWRLPEGVCLSSSPPERFGISIRRRADDAYTVELLWNHLFLSWACVSRHQLVNSALRSLLQALGTDLGYLLDQPIDDDSQSAPATV